VPPQPYPPNPGWQPPPYGYSPPPAAKQPPRKLWYGVGAALIVAGLAIGLLLGVGTFVDVMGKRPHGADIFANGESATVHFDDGQTRVIFVASQTGGHRVNCNVNGPAGDGTDIAQYDGTLTLNKWQAAFTVTAASAGDYQVSCIGDPSDEFGVGGDADAGAFVGALFGCLVGAGLFIAGVTLTILAAVLRHRRS
jgi:hypothetical protein